jgi:glycosyltransferase involved in cell wall biosynthesis
MSTEARAVEGAGRARSVASVSTRALRKVLVLAYRFPPQGGGGVQRALKFVKYLPSQGWLPVVQTVKNPYWPLQDQTLLNEIPPSVKVHRTRTFEFERFGRATEELLDGRGATSVATSKNGAVAQARRTGSLGGIRGLLKRAANGVQRHLLLPDPQITWVPGAFWKSLATIRRENISVIYSSSPPNSGNVLGLLLKRVTKLPWVADFRDPWTEGIRRKQAYEQSGFRRRIECGLERRVLEAADHVIVTTEKTLEQFLTKYPAISACKYSVITNGFDAADFHVADGGDRLLDARHFNMTLTGNVETMFDAAPFFTAVRDLLQEDEGLRTALRINFIGTKRGKYDAFIAENQLDTNVRYIGYVPHQTSLQYLAQSDVLFLCQIPVYESATTKLSGKLFEYLYMRKPILALTLPGLTTEILSRSGLGLAVDPTDQAGIKKTLRELYSRWREGGAGPGVDDAYIATFDRARQTERLAKLFDRLAQRSA